jgi:hypothetical protein
MSELVKLDEIVILPEIQIRVKISPKTIEEYAAGMAEGVKYDDIDLFIDDQERKILADGTHRLMAAQNRGLKTISATIHKCEPAEALSQALEMSLRKNGAHGLRLTPADKRRAVSLALDDKRIRKLGDKPIAVLCGVSPQLVKDVRKGEPKDVEVSDHKRSKPKPRSIPDEVVEDSDPTDERVRTLKSWVQEGKISWPDVAAVFSNDQFRAVRVALSNLKLQVMIGEKTDRERFVTGFDLIGRGVDQLLKITVKAPEA